MSKVRPGRGDRRDIERASAIARALGQADVGQGVVVAGGICLGLETIQGTDAMLDFVARTEAGLRRKAGVLFKAPKPGQDWRTDLPVIGPETLLAAHRAGLNGIAVEAGGVMILQIETVRAEADRLGLFVWGV